MNFLDLQYFLVAATEMNFTRAADRLYITQQSLSGRIAKLENTLGIHLFDRTPPLSLTAAGECVMRYARILIDQKQQMEQELQDLKDFTSGSLSIGVSNDRGTIILPEILSKFSQKYPHINLHVFEASTSQIMESLYNGTADLTISFPVCQEGVQSVPIYHETFVVVVPNNIFDAYFTTEQQEKMLSAPSLPIEVFRNCPFLAYSQATWLKEIFENCCSIAGIKPKIVMETSNLMTRSALCFSGMGIMFAAQSIFQEKLNIINQAQMEKVKIFKIQGVNYGSDISINFLNRRYRSEASKEFIRTAQTAMDSIFSIYSTMDDPDRGG